MGLHRPDDDDGPVDPYAGFDFIAETEVARAEGREPRLPRPLTSTGTTRRH